MTAMRVNSDGKSGYVAFRNYGTSSVTANAMIDVVFVQSDAVAV